MRRFFRNPKGLLILVLGGLTSIAALGNGPALVAPGLIAAVAIGMLIDAPILRLRKGRWIFPDGALLTGLIVAMILTPQAPWQVAAFASAVGVMGKYFLRGRTANVYNPAALGLLATYLAFHSGQSWWGALPDLPVPTLEPAALGVLIITGLVIADRVHRLPATLAFLGGYYLLFTAMAFLGEPGNVAAIYRASDLHAAIFFAFFMVTDPPTSPSRDRDQIIFGLLVAIFSYTVFELNGAVYYLLAGLLGANTWEAWRRQRVHAVRHAV